MIVETIWNHLVVLFGTVVLVTVIFDVAIAAAEQYRYARKQNIDKTTSDMKRVAVITGASGGLGQEYARRIDKNPKKYNVDEFWLIAGNKERLEETAQALHLPARIFPINLAEKKGLDTFEKFLQQTASGNSSFTITCLINSAGYGKYGSSAKIGHEEENRIIRVNGTAMITMTDIVVPFMQAGARILEVCSVAAFHPIPYFNAYAASKALIYSYSRALRTELLKKGISVTAVCPYWIVDTRFIEAAAGEERNLLLPSKTKFVVRASLWDMRKRYALSTPGIMATLDRIFAGLIPDRLLGYIIMRFL